MAKTARTIIYWIAVSLVAVVVCVLIRPAGLAANDGLSYYGVFRTTIVPYALAFLAAAVCYWRAGGELPNGRLQAYLAPSLKLMAILLVGLIVTPHTLVDGIHTTFGSILFALQLVCSFWLLFAVRFTWFDLLLVLLELAAGIAAFYYLYRSGGLLLQAQVVFQLAFDWLLIRLFNALGEKKTTTAEPND